ncbi:MAG: HD domain-containing protein [archaeon]|nr:MAG: HD domain-containing protein [archaeon]
MIFDGQTENEIRKRAFAYLKKGRKEDMKHTLRAVKYGKILWIYEGGNLDTICISLYFHDTGRYKLKDPKSIRPKDLTLHMEYGAKNVRKELEEIKYNGKKTEKIERIVSIHDWPDKVIEWGDIDAILTMESDRLDRYGKGAIPRFKECGKSPEYILNHVESGLDKWFITNTGKKIAKDLFEEMKEILEEKMF